MVLNRGYGMDDIGNGYGRNVVQVEEWREFRDTTRWDMVLDRAWRSGYLFNDASSIGRGTWWYCGAAVEHVVWVDPVFSML